MVGEHEQFRQGALSDNHDSACDSSQNSRYAVTKPQTSTSVPPSNARRVFTAMGGLALAIALMVWVVRFADIGGEDFAETVEQHWLLLLFAAIVSVGMQSWLSAFKWQMLHEAANGGEGIRGGRAKLTLYSTLAILLAQLLPASIAVPMVRGLATRLDMAGSFTRGAAITVYDQLFDVGVLVLVAIACAGLFWLGFSPELSLIGAILALTAALILASPFFCLIRPLRLASALVPQRLPGMRRIASSLVYAHDRGLDSPELAASLLRLSILRYLAVAFRSVAALLIAVPALSWADAAWGFGIVQASALLALTPGNMGITEWGWAGVGVLLEQQAGLFVIAILALRVLTVPATILVIATSWLMVRFSHGD